MQLHDFNWFTVKFAERVWRVTTGKLQCKSVGMTKVLITVCNPCSTTNPNRMNILDHIMYHLSAKGLCFPHVDVLLLVTRESCWMIVHSEFTSIMLDWLIPKSVNVVKEWTMHSIISSSVHDLVISASHWCKLLIRHGPKPTVKDDLVVLLHCCLHRPILMYLQRISARTFWTLFILSMISLDVAFNILKIHENGQKT